MQLIELVVQGVRGAPDLKRVAFGPGITVVPVADVRDRALGRIVLELLFPKGQEPALTDLDDGSGSSRVALTIAARDGGRWRLLMDLSSGRRALQKIAGPTPETVSTSPSEIAQVVTAQLGCPQEDVLRELLFGVREDMPSKRGRSSSSKSASTPPVKADKPLPPGFGGEAVPDHNADKPLPPGFGESASSSSSSSMNPALAHLSKDELKKRLAQIDEMIAGQQGIKEIEFELDGLQKKGFELEGKLKPLLTLRRSAEQAAAQVQRFSAIEGVPADLVEKGERLKRIRGDHERDLERVDNERAELIASLGPGGEGLNKSAFDVAQKDPFVLYGVTGGVIAIVLGFIGASADMPALRWLALLDIPAFGVAVFGALRVLASLEDREIVRRHIKRIDDEKKKLRDKFRIDEEQIEGLLKKHGFKIEQLPDLQSQLTSREEARQLLDQLKQSLRDAELGGGVRDLERQQQDLQQRIRVLEEKLQGQAAGVGFGDLQAERDDIVAALEGPKAPQPQAAAPTPVSERPEPTNPGLAAAEDLARKVVEAARDLYLNSLEEMAQLITPRATQILGALSDGRYKEVRFAGRGDCEVVDAASDEAIAFVNLPASDRDLIYLAVKVASVEAVLQRQRLPVLFDRGLDGFSDAKGELLKRMLGFLAQQTQVVCMTEKASLR